MTIEMAKVTIAVIKATHLIVFFHSGFKKRITRTPTRGRKVVKVSG